MKILKTTTLHLYSHLECFATVAHADLAKPFARAKPADESEISKTLETFGRNRAGKLTH